MSKPTNKQVYHHMHQLLLHQPTQHEKQLNQMMKHPMESPLVLQPQRWNCKIMYPRYLFDSRLSRHLQDQFIKWWQEYFTFPGSSAYDVKVQLVATTHRTLETLFIHKKPSRKILTKMERAYQQSSFKLKKKKQNILFTKDLFFWNIQFSINSGT